MAGARTALPNGGHDRAEFLLCRRAEERESHEPIADALDDGAIAVSPAEAAPHLGEMQQTIGSIERTRFAGIPLAALDSTVARPL